MKTETTRYDVAEHLRSPEEMALYLDACIEEAEGDAALIAKALGDIAKAQGMAKVARDVFTGLSGLSGMLLNRWSSATRTRDQRIKSPL
ncbi:MAG: addiction module antidote protein [Pseudomonadota bacterium]